VRSVIVRFPDGTREFRYPEKMLEEGDAVWHDGVRYRVLSVSTDAEERVVVTVEPDSNDLGDVLRSERGAVELVPFE
jgi:hypothetical protein